MCQGSLLSLSTIAAHKLAVVCHMRLGAKALQMGVLARDEQAARYDSGDEEHDGNSRFIIRNEPCPLCNVAPLDPFHLACVCTNATMVAWRTAAQAQARVLLDKIALLLRAAHSEMQRDLKTLCDEVSCESAALDVSAGSGQFILFRLLVMMP